MCVHLGSSLPLSLPQQEVPTLNASWVGGGRDAVGALDGRYRGSDASVRSHCDAVATPTLDHLFNASSYVWVLTHPNVAKYPLRKANSHPVQPCDIIFANVPQISPCRALPARALKGMASLAALQAQLDGLTAAVEGALAASKATDHDDDEAQQRTALLQQALGPVLGLLHA